MAEVTTSEIRACACGKVVAWLPFEESLRPIEIRREIVVDAGGKQIVTVESEDVHWCAEYPKLARFFREMIERSNAKRIRIRLPAGREPVVLSWVVEKQRVSVTNGRAPRLLRTYGSFSLKTGRYRARRRVDGLDDLLETIDRGPESMDWTGGRAQTDCCFCGRTLDDPRSVSFGYGPTCASKYGLPWW